MAAWNALTAQLVGIYEEYYKIDSIRRAGWPEQDQGEGFHYQDLAQLWDKVRIKMSCITKEYEKLDALRKAGWPRQQNEPVCLNFSPLFEELGDLLDKVSTKMAEFNESNGYPGLGNPLEPINESTEDEEEENVANQVQEEDNVRNEREREDNIVNQLESEDNATNQLESEDNATNQCEREDNATNQCEREDNATNQCDDVDQNQENVPAQPEPEIPVSLVMMNEERGC